MPKEIDAINKLYDLILWIIPRLEKFPRSQKFLLADRMETGLLDILDLLIEAAYSKEKGRLLRKANLKLEQVRYLNRIAKDLGYLGIKQYEFIVRSMNETGTSIGGWLKFTRNENV